MPQQVGEDAYVMLNGFGTVINALGKRAKPYLPQVRRSRAGTAVIVKSLAVLSATRLHCAADLLLLAALVGLIM